MIEGSMTDTTKLKALYTRMAAEQRAMIEKAAEAGVSPAAGTLQRIADLESALAAVEAMMEEGEP